MPRNQPRALATLLNFTRVCLRVFVIFLTIVEWTIGLVEWTFGLLISLWFGLLIVFFVLLIWKQGGLVRGALLFALASGAIWAIYKWYARKRAKELFEQQRRQFSEVRYDAYFSGRSLLPTDAKQSRLDTNAIESMEYCLFLRPFVWDNWLRSAITVRPETRAISARLHDHKYGYGIFEKIVKRQFRPSYANQAEQEMVLYSILGACRSQEEFRDAMSDLSFMHHFNIDLEIEVLFSLILPPQMPLIGLGESAHDQSDLGLRFNYSSEERWRGDIALLVENAAVILFIPWHSAGAIWELDHILSAPNLLAKTLLLVPGVVDARETASNSHIKGLREFEESLRNAGKWDDTHARIMQQEVDSEWEQQKARFDQVLDGIRKRNSLLTQRGLRFSQKLPEIASGKAFTISRREGELWCDELFSLGYSDFLFEKVEAWVEKAIQGHRLTTRFKEFSSPVPDQQTPIGD
jgi:hypothetical protein